MQQLTGSNYLDVIQKRIKNKGKVKLAIAFWGKGASKLLSEKNATDVQILCDVSMGASNADEIKFLQKLYGEAQIKKVDRFHAKVLIFEDAVIIGSANASKNALGKIDEEISSVSTGHLKTHIEYGMLSEDIKDIQEATMWFDKLFDEKNQMSSVITDADLKLLRKRNEVNRKAEREVECMRVPYDGQPSSILDRVLFNPEAFGQTSFVFVADRADEEIATDAKNRAYGGDETNGKSASKAASLKDVNVSSDCFTEWAEESALFTKDIIEFWKPRSRLKVFFREHAGYESKFDVVFTRKVPKSELSFIWSNESWKAAGTVSAKGAALADLGLVERMLAHYPEGKVFVDASSLAVAIKSLPPNPG
jgi:HKD family nuclease